MNIQIKFISYHNKRLAEFITYYLYYCAIMKKILKKKFNYNKNNSSNKINKFALIKSPFVYKKSQEVFQENHYYSSITLKFKTKEAYVLFFKDAFLNETLPSGISLKITKQY